MKKEQRSSNSDTGSPKPQGGEQDKPPIEQPGPIIIKGGGGGGGLVAAAVPPVDIDSPVFEFKDDDGKKGGHYRSDRMLRILSLRYVADNGIEGSVNFSGSRAVRIVVNIEE